MTIKVGIPRGLMYYEYFPMWNTFFKELGAEVIVSPITNKNIINEGIKCCIDEACLPIKVFHGHVSYLKDKCDYLFIPRLKSIKKDTYICPKFCGLPNMIKFSIKDLPNIIDTEINLRKNNNLISVYKDIGKKISSNTKKISHAYLKACKKQDDYMKKLRQGILPIDIINQHAPLKIRNKDNHKVALLGQVYTLYDVFVNMNLIDKLQNSGVDVITPEYFDDDEAEKTANKYVYKKLFWSHSEKIIGSMIDIIHKENIQGIIFIMSFGCGIDALVSELCERLIRRMTNLPFILLTIDEHTGDAGFNTRLEAFIDMMNWRSENESYISTHG